MDSDIDLLVNSLSGFGVDTQAAKTFASFQHVAEQSLHNGNSAGDVDMSNLDSSSFDMSALMDACRDISANQEVEDKVKKTNLFMRHVLEMYNEVIEEGEKGEEKISERFLKKLKKSKKREPSNKQNRRQNEAKGRGEKYSDKMNQKLLRKKRNLKTRSRMSVY